MSTTDNETQSPTDVAGDKLAEEFNELFYRTLREFEASGLSAQDFLYHMVITCQAGMIGAARTYARGLAYAHPEEKVETIKSETIEIVQQCTSQFAESLSQRLDGLFQEIEATRPKPKEKEE